MCKIYNFCRNLPVLSLISFVFTAMTLLTERQE